MLCATKKNMVINVIKTIMGEKDGRKMWQDLQALGNWHSSWSRVHLSQSVEIVISKATWVMPKGEWPLFFEVMANIKLPTRFAASFKKYMVIGKLGAMKSHDYHIVF